MMIEFIGDGCGNCRRLEKNLREAIALFGKEVEVRKHNDPAVIAEYGLLKLPGLAIDGKLVARGEILSPDKLLKLLRISDVPRA